MNAAPTLAELMPSGTTTQPARESATPVPMQPLLSASQLFKTYRKGPLQVPVLQGVDFEVRQGELLAIVGQSGSGKSTLLHLLGTLDKPDAGAIYFEGIRIDNLSSFERDRLRNQRLGMIFQSYHLMPELSALENVLMPVMIRSSTFSYWARRRQYRERATELLETVGLGHRMHHKPRELSGGEMQRTAIARALMSDPQILLADEPTGNLDFNTGKEVLDLLETLSQEKGLTVIMVTHDLQIAARADRTVSLVDGQVVKDCRAA